MYNLCCISNELKEQEHAFQTMTWKRYNDLCSQHSISHALNELGSRWLNNVQVTRRAMLHCWQNRWGYRVSSNLFPVLTHPEFGYDISDIPQYEAIMETFNDTAWENKNFWNVRLSTHPDQFNVLASENQASVDKTILELNHHGWVMDQLGCERSYYNPINIHINCTKGDLADIAARFMSNLNKCEQSVTSRLVVENEDKGCWTVDNLLKYLSLPVTYDNLHDKCNPSAKNTYLECAETWGDIKPLFHYSESHPDKTNPRSHADMPTQFPCSDEYDWDIELKSKDAAIRSCANLFRISRLGESAIQQKDGSWKLIEMT